MANDGYAKRVTRGMELNFGSAAHPEEARACRQGTRYCFSDSESEKDEATATMGNRNALHESGFGCVMFRHKNVFVLERRPQPLGYSGA